MSKRKEKSIDLRILSSLSAFLLLGAGLYVLFVGINLYSGAIITSAVLGLAVPGIMTGDGILEMIGGFFEAFFDGLMEVFAGILDFIGSIFG